jgi:ABC-type amino acid transport substrate-binding protein
MEAFNMKKAIRILAFSLAAISCIWLAGCSTADKSDVGSEEQAAGYVILDGSLASEEYGIGFRKGDPACDVVNAALQVLAADGTLAKISDTWFGYDITTVTADAKALDGLDTQKGRSFILGLDDSFPPMGYRDNKNEIVGFDIDMAKAVCDMLGWNLELQPIDWDAKELELNSKNIDCIWNGMTLTPERQESMSCSDAYMKNEQVLVVTAASGIQSQDDLKGRKLALQTGSSAEEALDSSADFKAGLSEVNTMSDNMTCFMDLEQGGVDAVLVDSIVAGWYIPTGNL